MGPTVERLRIWKNSDRCLPLRIGVLFGPACPSILEIPATVKEPPSALFRCVTLAWARFLYLGIPTPLKTNFPRRLRWRFDADHGP